MKQTSKRNIRTGRKSRASVNKRVLNVLTGSAEAGGGLSAAGTTR